MQTHQSHVASSLAPYYLLYTLPRQNFTVHSITRALSPSGAKTTFMKPEKSREIVQAHSKSKLVIPSEVVVVGTHPRTSKNYRKPWNLDHLSTIFRLISSSENCQMQRLTNAWPSSIELRSSSGRTQNIPSHILTDHTGPIRDHLGLGLLSQSAASFSTLHGRFTRAVCVS